MPYGLMLKSFTPTSLNRLTRGKFRERIRLAKGDRDVVCHEAREQGVPRATGKRRVSLLVVLEPGQRSFDCDAPWKGMLDALTHAGLILDDSVRHCEIGTLTLCRGEKRLTVVLLEDLGGSP